MKEIIKTYSNMHSLIKDIKYNKICVDNKIISALDCEDIMEDTYQHGVITKIHDIYLDQIRMDIDISQNAQTRFIWTIDINKYNIKHNKFFTIENEWDD